LMAGCDFEHHERIDGRKCPAQGQHIKIIMKS
jgi:hypothetical protein